MKRMLVSLVYNSSYPILPRKTSLFVIKIFVINLYTANIKNSFFPCLDLPIETDMQTIRAASVKLFLADIYDKFDSVQRTGQ